jgi:hypothetical protein
MADLMSGHSPIDVDQSVVLQFIGFDEAIMALCVVATESEPTNPFAARTCGRFEGNEA